VGRKTGLAPKPPRVAGELARRSNHAQPATEDFSASATQEHYQMIAAYRCGGRIKTLSKMDGL
jgi:hypothetical protein